jgi:dihydroflavonol-4-reductase
VRTVDLDVGLLAHATGHPNLDLLVADLTDPSTREKIVQGIDIVYHLASAHLDVRQPETHYRSVNVSATLGLARAAHAAGVQRFVHCSSVGVFGDLANSPADEDTPCFPTNIYERTKLEGEIAVLQFGQETGFDLVVARPAWVFGPRCPRTRKLLHAVGKGYFVIFGQGRNLRHPVYVSDAVRGLELCAQVPGIAGRIYILAGGEPVTVTQLVNVVADALNVPKPAIYLPLSLGKLAAWLMEMSCKPLGRQPPFSHRSLDFFSRNNAFSIEKARGNLGFAPQVDFRSGILRTLNWQEPLLPSH